MKVEDLIDAVHRRPPVWDRRHKLHANRKFVNKCWKEISAEMNMDETPLRKKWKCLRDHFVIEWSKVVSSTSGSQGDSDPSQASRWRYLRQLTFLKHVVKPRVLSTGSRAGLMDDFDSTPARDEDGAERKVLVDGVCTQDSAKSYHGVTDTEPLTAQLEGREDGIAIPYGNGDSLRNRFLNSRDPLILDSPPQATEVNNKKNASASSSLSIESPPSACATDERKKKSCREEEDDDWMFLKSLMPYVKLIPRHKKLRFRNRVQSVLEEFVYPPATTSETAEQPGPDSFLL